MAVAAILLALWQLVSQESGIQRVEAVAGDTPVTVFTAEGGEPGPVVLVAHGFAGSRRLMDAFSLSLARAGYTAVAFDFLGHGRHPRPLTGDLGDQAGTPTVLMGQVGEVVAWARELPGADGGLAVVGHSMATNILVRFAQETPGVEATVAISIMAPTTEKDSPPNLLAVAGEWEPRLVAEGRRVVALGAG
ncbi:MAG: alpha/beta fold hydrolase, partial [Gemmatimonadales bacterium]